MDASPCGHCLIINNMEFEPQSDLNNRKGSDVDCDKLEKRFKALNFIVEVKTNLRQKVGTFFFLSFQLEYRSACGCRANGQLPFRFSKSNTSCQLYLRRTILSMTAVWSSSCPMELR